MMMMLMKVAMTLCLLASLLLGSVSAGYGSPFLGSFNFNPYNNFYASSALYGGLGFAGGMSPFGYSSLGFGGLHLGGRIPFGYGSLGGGGYY
ncbi:hypothetical protein ACOMHN_033465 [Nucella lapillus]